MVFLKRNKNWMSKSVVSDDLQSFKSHSDPSSTHRIEQLIDQVREARAHVHLEFLCMTTSANS